RGASSALAAKAATSTIPVVFVAADPVGAGLVASLARPGGNLTGFSILSSALTPKRLELLSELVPQARLVALLVNPNSPSAESIIRDMQEAARGKGLQLTIINAGTESEINTANPRLTACWRAYRRRRSVLIQPARAARGSRSALSISGDLCRARIRRCRRPNQLRNELRGCLSPARHLRRKDPQGCQSRRSAGPAAYQVRAGH